MVGQYAKISRQITSLCNDNEKHHILNVLTIHYVFLPSPSDISNNTRNGNTRKEIAVPLFIYYVSNAIVLFAMPVAVLYIVNYSYVPTSPSCEYVKVSNRKLRHGRVSTSHGLVLNLTLIHGI